MKTKKLLSVLLTLTLLASLLTISALPAAAAEVSDWDALSAALAAGGAVVLTADVTAPAERDRILEVPAGVTASLDLAGFTLDGGTPGEEDCVVLVHGDFTLTDSSETGTGRITGTRDGVDVFGGSFTFESGAFDACGNNGIAAVDGGALTMTGGTVHGSGQIGVLVTGEGSTASVSGGEISGTVGYYEEDCFCHGTGFQVEYGGVAELAGGAFCGNVFGAKAVDAALTVSGGAFCDNAAVPITGGEYGGAGLYVYGSAVTISGGAFTGNSYAALYTDAGSVTEITGGTFDAPEGALAIMMLGGDVAFSDGEITGVDGIAVDLFGGSFTMTGGGIATELSPCLFLEPGAAAAISGGTLKTDGNFAAYVVGDADLTLSGAPVFEVPYIAFGLVDGAVVTADDLAPREEPLYIYSDVQEYTVETGVVVTGVTEETMDCFAAPFYCLIPMLGEDGTLSFVFNDRFPDVTASDWFREFVFCAVEEGFMEGTDAGFEPQKQMTNAMAVRTLWNYAGQPDASEDAASWYADALAWAAAQGFVDDADFAPDEPITREALCTLYYRYVRSLGLGFEGLWAFELDFPDAADVSSDALEAMSWFVMNGIINGMDGILNPHGTATRAQTATVLARLFIVLA